MVFIYVLLYYLSLKELKVQHKQKLIEIQESRRRKVLEEKAKVVEIQKIPLDERRKERKNEIVRLCLTSSAKLTLSCLEGTATFDRNARLGSRIVESAFKKSLPKIMDETGLSAELEAERIENNIIKRSRCTNYTQI